MAGVEVQNLTKVYSLGKQDVYALKDVSFSIPDRSFTVIVGESGCGKTTLLRLLGRLEEISCGQIDLTYPQVDAGNQRIGMIFQEPRLMPWLTVRENMEFSLGKQVSKEVARQRATDYLEKLGLSGFQEAYPQQLSGGMAQRVAIGRTLCYDPDLILMDEPFGALDYFTRQKLQKEIVALFLEQKKTIVFVTHDVTEAVVLGQKVIVMSEGCIKKEVPILLPYHRDIRTVAFLERQNEILDALSAS